MTDDDLAVLSLVVGLIGIGLAVIFWLVPPPREWDEAQREYYGSRLRVAWEIMIILAVIIQVLSFFR